MPCAASSALAAKTGNLQLLEWLLSDGEEALAPAPELINQDYLDELWKAQDWSGGLAAMLQLGWRDEEDDDAEVEELLTPLDLAITNKHLEVAQWLRADPARAQARPFSSSSPSTAKFFGDVSMLRWLHSLGPDVCSWDRVDPVHLVYSRTPVPVLDWLCFEAALMSIDDLSLTDAPLPYLMLRAVNCGDTESILLLRDKFNAKLPVSSAQELIRRMRTDWFGQAHASAKVQSPAFQVCFLQCGRLTDAPGGPGLRMTALSCSRIL